MTKSFEVINKSDTASVSLQNEIFGQDEEVAAFKSKKAFDELFKEHPNFKTEDEVLTHVFGSAAPSVSRVDIKDYLIRGSKTIEVSFIFRGFKENSQEHVDEICSHIRKFQERAPYLNQESFDKKERLNVETIITNSKKDLFLDQKLDNAFCNEEEQRDPLIFVRGMFRVFIRPTDKVYPEFVEDVCSAIVEFCMTDGTLSHVSLKNGMKVFTKLTDLNEIMQYLTQ